MTDQTKPVTDLPAFRDGNLANAILGLYGITGVGKTSLAITGIEEAWEVYHKITHWYSSDLGGWGTKLLSLIRLGICRVYYIRNHVDPFKTLDMITRGFWPEFIDDPETGLAKPDVRLIAPRQTRYTLVCPNGHDVVTYPEQAQVLSAQVACATCGHLTNATNAKEVKKQIVRPGLFKNVGHRVFDSMTQINEYGQMELRDKSARGELPTGSQGGSALGSADALREGDYVVGTGSKAQVGFLQDRTVGWIANARAIPDNVLPVIMTFGVETAKATDETGGIPIYGPKIAGNARTGNVGGWLGNLLYVCKEPHNTSVAELDEVGNRKMYHRLWLTNHVDPKDVSSTPYVAKHRGEPLGMPVYLEDDGDPAHAWEKCSLRVFYGLLRKQAEEIDKRDRARFKDAPALTAAAPLKDDVLETGSGGIDAGDGPVVLPTPSRIIRRSRRPTVVQDAAGAVVLTADVPAEQEGGTMATADQSVVPPPPSLPVPEKTGPMTIVEKQLRDSLSVAKAAPATPPSTASAAAPPRSGVANRTLRRVPRPPA